METVISPELLEDMKRYVQSKEYLDKYLPDWESDSDEYYPNSDEPKITRFLQRCGIDTLEAVATGKRWLTMPSSAFIRSYCGEQVPTYLSIIRKCANDINIRAGQTVLVEKQHGDISRFYNPTFPRSVWAIENIDKYDNPTLSGDPVSERCVGFILNQRHMRKYGSSYRGEIEHDYQSSVVMELLNSSLDEYHEGITNILAYQEKVERDYRNWVKM
ncbi:MAG TPA: hypothetical protein PLS49_08465 [Candidatus Woesebacteria bacterium]|nr:hypothetical protein [Candidatus Woesebacteria bacterium]